MSMNFKGHKGFEELIYADKIKLTKDEKEFNEQGQDDRVLIVFHTAPYESLLDKLRKQISTDKKENMDTLLYMRYKDTGDTWELGYISMTLDFWKGIEDIFYNYSPTFYSIGEDKLSKLQKLDYIHTGVFKGSELDGFIE